MAVVFVTKLENGESKNEGLCLKCARELGIPQVDSILSGMGISGEDLDNMEDEVNGFLSENAENFTDGEDGNEENSDNGSEDSAGRAPALDFAKFFGNLPFSPNKDDKERKNAEKDKEKKRRYSQEDRRTIPVL